MEWTDDGIVLGVRRHGESSAIAELLTRDHGEHLGTYVIEGLRLRAAGLLAASHAVYGVTHLASLVRLLPERDPHLDIYEMLERTLDDFDDAGEAAIQLVRFELAMLAELGFGLDLENCAATGATSDLVYVS